MPFKKICNKMSLRDISPEKLKGKKVFVRVDFNVPLENGVIQNDKRIRAALPTINYLIDHKAKVILCSHLDRPEGWDPKLSLKPVADRLSRLLEKEVKFIPDCVGEEVEWEVNNLKEGEVALLENVRFYKEETKNDPEFAKKLAKLADIYVNDAFGTAHRKHASTYGIAQYVEIAVAGFLLEKEIKYLQKALDNPERPLVLIIGGSKVSGKLEVIENLLKVVDKMLIGGGMAYTFLKAAGYNVGKSLVEEELLDTAKEIMEKAEKNGIKFYLPVDSNNADEFSPTAHAKLTTYKEIPDDMMGLDIGPATVELFKEALSDAKTILWNGPMGVFEFEKFGYGTMEIGRIVASHAEALRIVGGGDSVAAVEALGLEHQIDHVSTGGGAFLEFLAGKELPGVMALTDKK
ncbi:Phosphoglycerate kinase [Desulfurobacterium thermolithotrophum DSM 11699]|uniref:Phosphoglycerate kinase n=1 Tax=Desulfurobacterium thermolithotrophum (strain DSM 11699 / BSA) TaxID=868864 RepID=F0S0X7_DESTD|nr:phosphoglycerate kinase [Desulfurobacterium thermolithotrophum]ADY72781.1 Phosphoglycerate kinase [Desulfurobacterium thermolithotrophum DSM 11699]